MGVLSLIPKGSELEQLLVQLSWWGTAQQAKSYREIRMIIIKLYFKSNKITHVNGSNPNSKRNWDGVLLNSLLFNIPNLIDRRMFLRAAAQRLPCALFSYQGTFCSSNLPFFPSPIIRWLQMQESPPLRAHPPHFMEQYLSCRILTALPVRNVRT